MNNLTRVFALSAITAAAPIAAQPVQPGPQHAPSAATTAACTSQVANRWTGMAPADRANRSQAEMVRTCAINMDIAAYARAQNEMINADQQRAAAAMAAHEAAVAEFRASRNAWEAQVQQQKDDFAASYAQWEADVAACKGGNRSKCAPEQ